MRVALQLRLTGSTLEDAEELDQALKPRRFLGQPQKITQQYGPPAFGPTALVSASSILERRTSKIAAVAMANKIARMVWALMTRAETYREPRLQAA
jgi:hypothetical protein